MDGTARLTPWPPRAQRPSGSTGSGRRRSVSRSARGSGRHPLHGRESLFRNIAQTFENTLEDKERWHAELLQRMRLDLTPVRPAVIDDEAYEKLDELRRFRHLFRAAYGVTLDARRLELVLDKARQLQPLLRAQVEKFLDLVRAD